MKKYEEARKRFLIEVDPRRRQEVADSRMIFEDHRAMANLFPKAIYHTFNPDKYVPKLKPGYDEID